MGKHTDYGMPSGHRSTSMRNVKEHAYTARFRRKLGWIIFIGVAGVLFLISL